MKKWAFLALMAGPAQADCAGDWDALTGALQGAGLTVQVAAPAAEWGGWCSVGPIDVLAPGDFIPDYAAKSLKWKGNGLSGLYAFDALPESLQVELDDFRILTKTPDPVMTYLIRAQSLRGTIDLDLQADWDQGTKTLTLQELELDFPGENTIVLQATVTGVDLSGRSAILGSATSFTITSLDLTLQTNGLFETYLLFPLFSSLLTGEEPPETQMTRLKASIATNIAGLPDTALDANSKAALDALTQQLPNPSGTLHLNLTAPNGIGPAQTLPFILLGVPKSPADLAPILNGVTLKAEFTPSEDDNE